MGHDHPTDAPRWPATARPRRLNLGDLMSGVALAALVLSAAALLIRSELGGGRRAAFAALALLVFALQAAQWRLGGLPATDLRSRRETWLGVTSYLIAMATFVLLLAISALFPEGAALVILALIVAAMYLSTWD